MTKQANPTTAEIGDTITYTVTVINNGTGPGSTDAKDTYDTEHLQIDDFGGGVDSDPAGTITFSTGTLSPGETQAFVYSGTLIGTFEAEDHDAERCEPANQFPVINSVTVDGDDPVEATVCVIADPESGLAKQVRNVTDDTAFADSVTGDPEDVIEFQLTYSNTGVAEATNVVITDLVPDHMTFVSCEPVLSLCGESGGTVTWNVGDVEAGGSRTVSFQAQLDDAFPLGMTVIGNVASVTTDQEPTPTDSNEVIVTVTRFEKASCPSDTVVPGGVVKYSMDWGVHGRDLDGVVITDTLPAEFRFESATPTPTSAPAVGSSGTIVWDFGTVADGTTGTVTVTGTVDESTPLETVVTNEATIEADIVPVTSATDDILVTIGGSGTDERAYGVSLDLLGQSILEPQPDTDPSGDPAELLSLVDPVTGDVAKVDALTVQESGTTDALAARSSAIATTASVKLLDQDAGPDRDWLVSATKVRSVSSSFADRASAGSSSAGSVLENVVVAGQNIGTVTEPTSFEVVDPVLGTTATIHLLEKIESGAAAGEAQPSNLEFHSGLTINAIHVTVTDGSGAVLTDVVVASAASSATFESGLKCDDGTPHVSGVGFAYGQTADEDILDDSNTLQDGMVARVMLPNLGGEETSTVKHVGPISIADQMIAESNAAFAHTIGSTDPDADAATAATQAQIEALRLIETAPGEHLITADKVRAEVSADATGDPTAGTTGTTILENLVIGGTDVCATLGLESVCTPDPNTVIEVPGLLVILNEQIVGPSGPSMADLTVNAIHIHVLGEDNPLDLPVGVEIIVASAHADARSADAVADPPSDEVVTSLLGSLALPLPGEDEGTDDKARREAPSTSVREPEAPAADQRENSDPIRGQDLPSDGGSEEPSSPLGRLNLL